MNRNIITLLLALSPLFGAAQSAVTFDSQKRDMGTIIYNNARSADFIMKNTGNKPVRIKNVTVSCGCTAVKWDDKPVPAGGSTTITVSYDAAMLGHFTKQVGIFTDDSPTPVYLSLYGTVVARQPSYSGQYPYSIGDIKLNTLDLMFDNVNNGDSPEQILEVYNGGSTVYTPELTHLPKYLQAKAVPEKLAPGHGGQIIVTLQSRDLRSMGLTQTSVYLSRFPGDKVGEDNEIDVSAILLPAFAKVTEAQMAYMPRLVMSADTIDLGAFGTKDKLKGVIEIANQGKTDLQIRSIQVFSTALNVDMKRKIAAGGTAKLKITALKRFLRQRSLNRLNVLMITNDPKNPKVLIHVKVKP